MGVTIIIWAVFCFFKVKTSFDAHIFLWLLISSTFFSKPIFFWNGLLICSLICLPFSLVIKQQVNFWKQGRAKFVRTKLSFLHKYNFSGIHFFCCKNICKTQEKVKCELNLAFEPSLCLFLKVTSTLYSLFLVQGKHFVLQRPLP